MAAAAATLAAEFDPDVVHYEFHVMAQYIPVIRSACPGAACIVTEHEPGVTADAGRGASIRFREWIGGLARRRAWSRYERHALRMADAIIVFTPSDAAALELLLGPKRPPISVIPLRLPGDASSLSSRQIRAHVCGLRVPRAEHILASDFVRFRRSQKFRLSSAVDSVRPRRCRRVTCRQG